MYYESPIYMSDVVNNVRKISNKYHFMNDLDGILTIVYDNKITIKFNLDTVNFMEAHSESVDLYPNHRSRLSLKDSGISFDTDFGEYFADDKTDYWDEGGEDS